MITVFGYRVSWAELAWFGHRISGLGVLLYLFMHIVETSTVLFGPEVYDAAVAHCRPGASLAELDRLVREGVERIGYRGQPSHPICHGVGARAHEPPYAHQVGGGEMAAGMVLAIEPGCYMNGGGGLRVEDNFLVSESGAEKLSPFPDGIVRT